MPLLFRSMIIDGEKPLVGADDNNLGVRVPPHPRADIEIAADGTVSPGGGGLSVAPSLAALARIPFFVSRRLRDRFPRARGVDELVTWRIGEGTFEAAAVAVGLHFRPDEGEAPRHGVIEPDSQMPLADY